MTSLDTFTAGADILVVDDNRAHLTAIEAALGELSSRVVRAESGPEALRLLLERDFALILLDVQMPTLDGFETARLIRARKRSRHTPIVFVTADGGDDARVLAGYELGAVDYLPKPVRSEVLRAKVQVFVELHARNLEVRQQAAQIREHQRREHDRSVQAEREHWQAEELRRQMHHLARAERHKDRFLTVLSHELRNPLASIVAGIEILREKMEPVDTRVDNTMSKTRDVVERQAKHLTGLVDDLLDVTRISSGKIELRREEVALSHVVEQAVGAIRASLEERAHELSVLLPDGPLTLNCDPLRVVQVLANLLSNAARYTAPGGKIEIACTPHKSGIEIRVTDNGRGIAHDFLPFVFEAFSQESETTGAGLGVGLSVVRQLVALHQGTVEVHSAGPDQGARFTVWLPLAAYEVTRAAAAPFHSDPAVMRPISIVLIEDREDVRELMAELLRGWGHQVEVAADGESGVDLVLRCQPDVALIDIGLPKLDGYGVATRLRAESELKTRLIAMTGFGQEADKCRTADAGFDSHLVKPASIEALRAALTLEKQL